MYALNVLEHSRWISIENRAHRFWIRAWIDSLHVGTHVHWQLCPLSILGLAHLWEYVNRQDRQYTKRQRTSIKVMALRRHADPTLLEPLPAFHDEVAWDSFFDRQIVAGDQIHDRLLEWHLKSLESCSDLAIVYSSMTVLFSSLLLRGYNTDRLFRAVCKGVLDPQNLRGRSPSDNLYGWLQSLAKPEAAEFIAYTKPIPLGSISKTLLSKWSNVKLASVDGFDSDRTLPVLIGDKELQPYIITRRTVTGGIGELHRREARHVYAQRLQKFPELSIFAFPDRSHFRSSAPGAEEKYHDVSFKRTGISIEISGEGQGANLFQKATRELFDSPEDAVRDLVVAVELRWKRDTPKATDQVLANAYRWRLRTRLGEDFANYMARVRSIAGDPRVPAGSTMKEMASWNWEDEKDYQLLLQRLTTRPDIDDDLVLARLREVTSWYYQSPAGHNELMGLANTYREIASLLSIIRGVRNSATHFKAADHKLYGFMLYLAKVLFEACAAAWTRDSVEAEASEPSVLGESAEGETSCLSPEEEETE